MSGENAQKLLGRWGEAAAAAFLTKKKYTVTAMSYKSRFGEIDIIAENRKYIVFAEVKLRRDGRFARPREFVNRAKQERTVRTAQMYLAENETEKQPRFDVIEIYAPDGTETEKPVINHIENAY